MRKTLNGTASVASQKILLNVNRTIRNFVLLIKRTKSRVMPNFNKNHLLNYMMRTYPYMICRKHPFMVVNHTKLRSLCTHMMCKYPYNMMCKDTYMMCKYPCMMCRNTFLMYKYTYMMCKDTYMMCKYTYIMCKDTYMMCTCNSLMCKIIK